MGLFSCLACPNFRVPCGVRRPDSSKNNKRRNSRVLVFQTHRLREQQHIFQLVNSSCRCENPSHPSTKLTTVTIFRQRKFFARATAKVGRRATALFMSPQIIPTEHTCEVNRPTVLSRLAVLRCTLHSRTLCLRKSLKTFC